MGTTLQRAKFISYLFHPIIYPILVSIMYMLFIPRYMHVNIQYILLSVVVIGTLLIPIVVLTLLKKNGMISSFHLSQIDERKFPLFIFTILSLLISRMFFKMEITFDLGLYFIGGSIGMIISYWVLWFDSKWSLHTMGLGSFMGFFLYLSMHYHLNFLWLYVLLLLLFAWVSGARVYIGAHKEKECIFGFLLGVLSQLVMPLLYQKI